MNGNETARVRAAHAAIMEEPPEKKARPIHFGSFEEQERKRTEEGAKDNAGPSVAILAGIKAGNINITRGEHQLGWHWDCNCIVMLKNCTVTFASHEQVLSAA